MTRRTPSDPVAERAALYALDALPPEEGAEVAADLAADAELSEEVAAYAAVVDALGWAARPQTPPPGLRAAVLSRIGAAMPDVVDEGGLRFVRGQHRPWEATPIAGIEVRPLWEDAENGRRTAVVRLAPGAEYPRHRHADVEEIYLIEGDLVVSGVPMQAGDYCRAAAGTVHDGVRSPSGCVLLVSLSARDEYLE